jgi:hypothetical protein
MDILAYTFYRYSARSIVRTSIKNSTSVFLQTRLLYFAEPKSQDNFSPGQPWTRTALENIEYNYTCTASEIIFSTLDKQR